MAPCLFFKRGICKFGNACRNEHIKDSGGTFGASSWNNNASNASSSDNEIAFTIESIKNDISGSDKPMWPLSSYGPGKSEPCLLIGLDQSFEELRVNAVQAKNSGRLDNYIALEKEKSAAAEQVFLNTVNNIVQARAHSVRNHEAMGKNGIPTGFTPSAAPSAFSASTSAFGNTSGSPFSSTSGSAFGGLVPTSTSAFGKPAFGQPAFGQPSTFGQVNPSNPTSTVFGQPSVPPPITAFVQPSTPAFAQNTPAFGQTSMPSFGQTSQPQSSFIKPATGSAFSSYANQSPSIFGSPGTGSAGVFGKPATSNTFENSAAPKPGSNSAGGFSAFAGQPTSFGSTNPATSGFGGPSATSQPSITAFGSSTPGAPQPVFGAPSTFGAPAQPQKPASTFGSAFTTPNTGVSVFAPSSTSTPGGFNSSISSPFVPPTQNGSAFGQPSITDNSSKSAFGTSAPPSMHNQPSFSSGGTRATVSSSNPHSGRPRVDFTSTVSPYKPGLTPYDQKLGPEYAKNLPADVLEAFSKPKFEWGMVPEWIPPLESR